MKKYQLPLIVLWTFLEYNALGIIIYWFCKIKLPFEVNSKYSLPLAIGVIVIMPIVSYFLVRKGQAIVNKTLGYIGLISWIIVLIRFLTLFN